MRSSSLSFLANSGIAGSIRSGRGGEGRIHSGLLLPAQVIRRPATAGPWRGTETIRAASSSQDGSRVAEEPAPFGYAGPRRRFAQDRKAASLRQRRSPKQMARQPVSAFPLVGRRPPDVLGQR
jgi:hypothetical protein